MKLWPKVELGGTIYQGAWNASCATGVRDRSPTFTMPTSVLPRSRVAILQSCYIPWKGYFDIIRSVDTFVVFDDVQYPQRGHWHNRNLIKTQHGSQWLSVPVTRINGALSKIEDMTLALPFIDKHWQSIANAYARAPHFKSTGRRIEAMYRDASRFTHLSELNVYLLKAICEELDIRTKFVWSRDLAARGHKTDRLVAICQELGAARYLSGPSAKAYLEDEKFTAAGIEVEWMDYSRYPEYPQLHGPFQHAVTILDLLFNVGPDAAKYLVKTASPESTT